MLPDYAEWQQPECQWHGTDVINRMKLYLKSRTNELCKGIVSISKNSVLPTFLTFNFLRLDCEKFEVFIIMAFFTSTENACLN